MAERGTFFEPNIGLVSQNYIENKPRYLGIGNYDEQGFRYMEQGIPLKLSMFKQALRQNGLKLIMGTDATAGAHGQNAREIAEQWMALSDGQYAFTSQPPRVPAPAHHSPDSEDQECTGSGEEPQVQRFGKAHRSEINPKQHW